MSQVRYDVHDRPNIKEWIPLVSSTFCMFSATVLVPLLTG